MRLLIVDHKTVWGGGQVALVNLLRSWQTTRPSLTPIVVCPPDAALAPRVRALGIDCETFDLGVIDKTKGAAWNFGQRARPTSRLLGLMRRTRTDVVLANGAFSFLACVFAAKLTQVPVVWLEHNTTLPSDATVRRMLGWAKRIVVVSGAIETQFVTLEPKARGKISVVYNGTDPKHFAKNRSARRAIRRQLGWDEPTPLVGTVSRLSPEKGVSYFVQAAHEILRTQPQTRFVIVGDGPLRPELERTAPRDQLRFVGAQDNVAEWLNALDVFVMPSLAEAFGIAVVEAMACELPVVASDVGGLREIVVERETGLRVPPQDPQALARAVSELMQDEKMRRTLGAAGRARVKRLFTLKRQADLMGKALEQVRK